MAARIFFEVYWSFFEDYEGVYILVLYAFCLDQDICQLGRGSSSGRRSVAWKPTV